MKEIPLTKGFVALVDDEDYEWLSQVKWHASTGYARTRADTARFRHHFPDRAGPGKILMHHLILGVGSDVVVDHKSLNRADNQRHNLRIATSNGNARNISLRSGTSSRFKGVSWRKDRSLWVVGIRVNGARKHLGFFADEMEAAKAYDVAAQEMHGEFCSLNFKE